MTGGLWLGGEWEEDRTGFSSPPWLFLGNVFTSLSPHFSSFQLAVMGVELNMKSQAQSSCSIKASSHLSCPRTASEPKCGFVIVLFPLSLLPPPSPTVWLEKTPWQEVGRARVHGPAGPAALPVWLRRDSSKGDSKLTSLIENRGCSGGRETDEGQAILAEMKRGSKASGWDPKPHRDRAGTWNRGMCLSHPCSVP